MTAERSPRAEWQGEIVSGSLVLVKTVDGKLLKKTAISPVIDGRDFPVVWCVWDHEYQPSRAAEWEDVARRFGYAQPADFPGSPWPSEDVTLRG